MSELQLGLVSVGLAILLLLVGYNAWRRFKIRRMLPRSTAATAPKAVKKKRKGWPWGQRAQKNQSNWHDSIEPSVTGNDGVRDAAMMHEAIEPSSPPLSSYSSHYENPQGEYTQEDAQYPQQKQTDFAPKTRPLQPENHFGAIHTQDEMESADVLAARLFKGVTQAHINERIDAIVELKLSGPTSAERLITLAQRQRRVGNKPILLEGKLIEWQVTRQEDAVESQAVSNEISWTPPEVGERYEQIRVAVQLANRSGALNELEFSDFVTTVRALAKTLNATFDLPTMQQTMTHARELDAFAAQCDVQLCINILSDGAPWSAQYIQQIVTQDEFVLSRDGSRFVKVNEQNKPLFMLYCGRTNFLRDDLTYSGSPVITLLLDVPTVDEEQEPFRAMVQYARALAEHIGGRLVDDQHQPLLESALSAIEKRLMGLYGTLEEAGLPAGESVTRRLFSHG